jgi:hypothetical protein
LSPKWNSPNRRQQCSPIRGGYQSPKFREQGRGQGQYQGQNKGFTPTSEQGRGQGQNKGFTPTSELQFRGSPQNHYRQSSTFSHNQESTHPPHAVNEQKASMNQLCHSKEHLNGKGSE